MKQKNKKLYVTFGAMFGIERNMFRIDIRNDDFNEDKWLCFESIPTHIMAPYISMEIINNEINIGTIKNLIKELELFMAEKESENEQI
jgi:hypothetical protein